MPGEMANNLRTVRVSPFTISWSGRALCFLGALVCLCCVLLTKTIAPQLHQSRYLATAVVNLGSNESVDLAVEATDPALARRILAHQAQTLWESGNPTDAIPDFRVSLETIEPKIGAWTGLLNIIAVCGFLGAFLFRPTPPKICQTSTEPDPPTEQGRTSSVSVRVDPKVLPMLDLVIGQILECSSQHPRKFLIMSPELSPRQESRASFSLQLAHHFAERGSRVDLFDLDLKEGYLTRLLSGGDRNCVGLTEWLLGGGELGEFLMSLPWCPSVNFAPVGLEPQLPLEFSKGLGQRLLSSDSSRISIVEASIAPHLTGLLEQIDMVVCFSEPGLTWTPDEQAVLGAIRRANLPVWGIAKSRPQAYPLY